MAQWLEHCIGSAKVVGSIPREHTYWQKKCIDWMHCKSLWIKASDKCKCYIRQPLIFWKSYFQCYKNSFLHLGNIAKLRKRLSVSDAEKLIHAFMTSRLDYCNALLDGCPAFSINKLQMTKYQKKYKMLRLESLPGQENMTILPQFYSLCTGYLLSSVSVTKYYYLPIRP